ncbi:MAG: rhodanese-like domain-containing protein [Vicinamibacterales bacterium]
MTPAEFAAELASATGADKPVVVCTAPPFLYRVGHIPGSILHGPASAPEGLDSLTKWAETLPRTADVVIYCGCCPLAHCPNLSPAYKVMKRLGFTRVRVLLIQDSFKADWVDRGYPVER